MIRRILHQLARLRWPDQIICPFCRMRWRQVNLQGWQFPQHYRHGKPCPGSLSPHGAR